ncbi:growth-regulating factor 4 isoform X4 [Arachis hypogaea]|nr:growth-regulating factor 6 isoform X4 [Arachis hypogaea]
MASGTTVPPDLLFTLKRSHFNLPHHQPAAQQQHFGWNYLEMGLGRKIDPEPGRCRRTDGKKWRCSKEAYPDSKYCERHMHRGKNRSRKPVELLKTTTNACNSASSATTHTIISSPSSITKTNQHPQQRSCYNNGSNLLHQHSFVFNSHTPSRSSTSAVAFSFQDNTAPSSRYVYGVKEDADERAFFKEPSSTLKSFSGSSIDDSWQLTPLTISTSSSSSSTKQRRCTSLSNNIESLNERSKNQEQDQKTTVHSFFDEWPHKGRGFDSDDKCSSTTKLSISIPSTSFHDFPVLQFKNPPHC